MGATVSSCVGEALELRFRRGDWFLEPCTFFCLDYMDHDVVSWESLKPLLIPSGRKLILLVIHLTIFEVDETIDWAVGGDGMGRTMI